MFDDLANAHCDLLAALDDVLKEAGANDMAQGGLSTFDERLTDIRDGEGGAVGLVDVVVDNGSD